MKYDYYHKPDSYGSAEAALNKIQNKKGKKVSKHERKLGRKLLRLEDKANGAMRHNEDEYSHDEVIGDYYNEADSKRDKALEKKKK